MSRFTTVLCVLSLFCAGVALGTGVDRFEIAKGEPPVPEGEVERAPLKPSKRKYPTSFEKSDIPIESKLASLQQQVNQLSKQVQALDAKVENLPEPASTASTGGDATTIANLQKSVGNLMSAITVYTGSVQINRKLEVSGSVKAPTVYAQEMHAEAYSPGAGNIW
jgi:hypothetical protein